MEENNNLIEDHESKLIADKVGPSSTQKPLMETPAPQELTPSLETSKCATCSNSVSSVVSEPVYAIGNIEARFSTPAAEKEFSQAVGRTETSGQTDQQAFYIALSKRENRYLARKLCWVFKIQGIETYLLKPSDPSDLELLVEAIRPEPSPMDLDIVIGRLGPISPPEQCNGLMIPTVTFEQIYSFDWKTLVNSVPKPKNVKADKFEATIQEVLHKIIKNIDNAGASSQDRARNYLIMRYGGIYSKCAEYHENDFSLTSVDAKASQLSGTRNIMDVILSFTSRKTDVVEKYFVRVDVTEEFPFLVSKIAPYFDR